MSKHNSNRGKQIIVLIILNGKGQHYNKVKRLPELLRGMMLRHHGDFCCLNSLHSFRTENQKT